MSKSDRLVDQLLGALLDLMSEVDRYKMISRLSMAYTTYYCSYYDIELEDLVNGSAAHIKSKLDSKLALIKESLDKNKAADVISGMAQKSWYIQYIDGVQYMILNKHLLLDAGIDDTISGLIASGVIGECQLEGDHVMYKVLDVSLNLKTDILRQFGVNRKFVY